MNRAKKTGTRMKGANKNGAKMTCARMKCVKLNDGKLTAPVFKKKRQKCE